MRLLKKSRFVESFVMHPARQMGKMSERSSSLGVSCVNSRTITSTERLISGTPIYRTSSVSFHATQTLMPDVPGVELLSTVCK